MATYNIDIPEEIDTRLSAIGKANDITVGEAMRRAFALLSVAEDLKSKDQSLGIIKQTDNGFEIVGRILGV